jgi:hypothetical protein
MKAKNSRPKTLLDPLTKLATQNSAWAFRGGTVGSDAFTWKRRVDPIMGSGPYISTNPITGQTKTVFPEMVPVLSEAAKKAGVKVLPVGTAGKQEYAGLRTGKYVEAPEEFRRGRGTSERDSAKQFYSKVTGRPMGTLMGTGDYKGFGGGGQQSSQRSWDNYVSPSGPRNPSYGSNPERIAAAVAESQIPKSSMGITGESPLAFTGFGSKTGFVPRSTPAIEPMAESPFYNRFGYGASYGLFPQFPFAGQY